MALSEVGVDFNYTYNGKLSTEVLFKPTVGTPAVSDFFTIYPQLKYGTKIPLLLPLEKVVKKYTSWKVKTIYEDNYIIIGKYYNGEPYLKINRYNLDVFYNDHQRNDHNGKCKKLKKAI